MGCFEIGKVVESVSSPSGSDSVDTESHAVRSVMTDIKASRAPITRSDHAGDLSFGLDCDRDSGPIATVKHCLRIGDHSKFAHFGRESLHQAVFTTRSLRLPPMKNPRKKIPRRVGKLLGSCPHCNRHSERGRRRDPRFGEVAQCHS